MRFLKFLFFLVIIALIAGGTFYANQMGWDWAQISTMLSGNNGTSDHNQHQGHGSAEQRMATPFNNQASLNKDKLNQAMSILTQAMELITTDPYSQITIPNKTAEMRRESGQSGTVNVTPKDGVTINVSPSGQAKTPDLTGGASVVFDQNKLEQLHNGIFKFSQATILLQELNSDLADQSILAEANPPNEQTYLIRYNLTLQNRNKLNQANRLLQEALVLANVNPYAPADGYVYNAQKMQQLHTGISELAKSALVLSRLSEDFNQQMLQIAAESRMARQQQFMQNSQNMQGMQGMQGMQHGSGMFSGDNTSWIYTIGMLVIVLGIVLGILVLIKRLLNEFREQNGINHK